MVCYGAPDHNSKCSSTVAFNNALLKVPFSGLASDTNAAIMVPQIKAGFVRKHDMPANQHASLYADWPIVAGDDDSLVRGVSCIKESLRAVHAAAHVYELMKHTMKHL